MYTYDQPQTWTTYYNMGFLKNLGIFFHLRMSPSDRFDCYDQQNWLVLLNFSLFFVFTGCQLIRMAKVFFSLVSKQEIVGIFPPAQVPEFLHVFLVMIIYGRLPLLSHERNENWLVNTVEVIHFTYLKHPSKRWPDILLSTDRVPPWQLENCPVIGWMEMLCCAENQDWRLSRIGGKKGRNKADTAFCYKWITEL